MGHLIHPIASRLGHSTFWNSNSVTFNNKNYIHFCLEDIFFQNLFNWFYSFLEKDNFIFTHVIVSRVFTRIMFCNIIYNSEVDSKWFSFFNSSFKTFKKPKLKKILSIKSLFLKDLNRSSSPSLTSLPVKKIQSFSELKRRNILFFKKYKGFRFLKHYKKFSKLINYNFFNNLLNTSKISKFNYKTYKTTHSLFIRFLSFLKKFRKNHKNKLFTKRLFHHKFKAFSYRRNRIEKFAVVKKTRKYLHIKNLFFVTSKLFSTFKLIKNLFLKTFFKNYFYSVLRNRIKLRKTLTTKLFKKPFFKRWRKKRNFRRFIKPTDAFSLHKKEYFLFFKRFTNYFKFFSLFHKSSRSFFKLININIYNFFKTLSSWYLYSFKTKLLGFFMNSSLLVNNKLGFFFYFLTSGAFNASLICRYITIRLQQGALLFDIIKPLILKLVSFERMSGFKISCAGRFSRRQIAAYSWQIRGELPLNSFGRVVDYNNSTAFLNNSLCGLKVWLCFPEKFLRIKKKGFFFSGRSFCL